MGQRFGDEAADREFRLDRDFEREGGYRTPYRVQLDRRGTLRTLIEKRRADAGELNGPVEIGGKK